MKDLIETFPKDQGAKGFLKVINDDTHREQITQNGFENVNLFDSQKIANDYFNLYRKIAKANV